MTTDELPRCRLCGHEPTQLSGGRVSHICVVSEAEWRRLHGPRLEPETVDALRACAAWHDGAGGLWTGAIRAALAALGEV